MFYKMYCFSKAQEKTIEITIGFATLAAMFESFHLLIFLFAYESFVGKHYIITLGSNIFILFYLLIGYALNYLIFFKSKKIEHIYAHFKNKKYSLWKENCIFFSYYILLFIVMFYFVSCLGNVS